MAIYSQRDVKWKDQKMGDGTLGTYGCLVTCLSMMSNITPDVLNNEIKAVNGYSGNYLIWDKLDSIKGFDFIKRVKTYDNEDVLANLPCPVEVDGSPIGGVTHWVLYIGDHKIYDPWDGLEKLTGTYKAIGYAVVKITSSATTTTPEVEVVKTNTPKVDLEEFGTLERQAILSSLRDKDKKINRLQTDNQQYQQTVADLTKQLEDCDKPQVTYVEHKDDTDPSQATTQSDNSADIAQLDFSKLTALFYRAGVWIRRLFGRHDE